MTFKLRFMPFLISIVASSVLLFGGWFVYSSMALQKPIEIIVNEIAGVEHANTQVLRDQVVIELSLAPEASMREIMQQIEAKGHSVLEKRELQLSITNSSSVELDRWWSTALFDVAQAMETKQYSHIPTTLTALKDSLAGLQVVTEMDETHVYVKLLHDGSSKFIMLPRTPNQLEVWPHD